VGERHAGEARADEVTGMTVDIVGVIDGAGESLQQPAPTRHRERAGHRIRARCPQRLEAVSQRVHPRCGCEARGHTDAQFGVVDHRARERADVVGGVLPPVGGAPPDRRHLGARIRGRQCDQRQVTADRDHLPETGCRPTANRHDDVGAARARHCGRGLDSFGGNLLLLSSYLAGNEILEKFA
jgi:hypothetical protein